MFDNASQTKHIAQLRLYARIRINKQHMTIRNESKDIMCIRLVFLPQFDMYTILSVIGMTISKMGSQFTGLRPG